MIQLNDLIFYSVMIVLMIGVGVMGWVLYYGNKLVKEKYTDLSKDDIIKYLESLDVYVVSSGGLSSNYINDYFKKKGLKVGEHGGLWGRELCHTKTVYTDKTKTLCIYGDWKNALHSQQKRGLSEGNINKIHGTKGQSLKYFIDKYPTDPYGLKEQYSNFSKNPNTWMLKYPYTKEELQKVIREMGFTFNTDDIEVKERSTNVRTDFDTIVEIYHKYDPYA